MNVEQLQNIPPIPTALSASRTKTILVPGIIGVLIGGILGYITYPIVNSTEVITTDAIDQPLCSDYGTFTVQKNDLLEKYTVGPDETLRDVARKLLEDETEAVALITANPQLREYGVDDTLPLGVSMYIPDEKYSREGVTTYIKARGNITFDDTKPMFGINAPNAATGPFIISDYIQADLTGVQAGDCVEVIYGSRGSDPQKFVFEVLLQ